LYYDKLPALSIAFRGKRPFVLKGFEVIVSLAFVPFLKSSLAGLSRAPPCWSTFENSLAGLGDDNQVSVRLGTRESDHAR